MTAKAITILCAGCGHVHRAKDQSDPYDHATYASLQLAPDVEVPICGGGRSMNGAKIECAIKASRKESLCPGCGDKVEWPIKTLCGDCKSKISLAERVQKQEETRRRTVTIENYRILDPGSDQEEERAIATVIDLLAAATGSERVRGSGESGAV